MVFYWDFSKVDRACVRGYVHMSNLVKAYLFALHRLDSSKGLSKLIRAMNQDTA